MVLWTGNMARPMSYWISLFTMINTFENQIHILHKPQLRCSISEICGQKYKYPADKIDLFIYLPVPRLSVAGSVRSSGPYRTPLSGGG